MTTYTVGQLSEEGPQYAMALLLQALSRHEPFVTYGAIGRELEFQLGVKKIFPTQIGHVAGSLMNRILELDPDAPLINVMITQPSGVPGSGAGGYLANRYKKRKYRDWEKLTREQKLEAVAQERALIYAYQAEGRWEKINGLLFGTDVLVRLKKEQNPDDYPGGYGGVAESEEHRRLKLWVAENPAAIGLPKRFIQGETEHLLLSGDEVDVMFSCGNEHYAVEVKSRRSNESDLQRGIYQCVKYRAVKEAENLPYVTNVKCILVTETPLPPELAQRAKELGVRCKVTQVQ